MKDNVISRLVCKLPALLCAVVVLALFSTAANAQTTIAGWDFNGLTGGGASPQAPTSTNANVTVVGLTRGSAFSVGGSAVAKAWGTTVSVTNLTSAAAAVSSNSFASFAVKANAGFTLSLSNIAAYNVRRSSTGPTTGQWQYSTNGTAFTDIGSAITWGSTTTSNGNSQSAVNLSGISALQDLPSSVTVTFRVALWGGTSGSGTWYLNNFQTGDDFILTGAVAASGPAISTTGSLNPFSTTAGTASADQSFNATGVNLTQNITVTAPADFEVATNGVTFFDTLTIAQSGGTASAAVSVRIKASAAAGSKSGNIVLSSAGATDVNVAVTGNVIEAGTPQIILSTNAISGLSTSTGVASAATNYSVTGTNLGFTPVTITPDSALLEVGTNGTNFASTVSLTPSGGTVSNTIFLRVAATNVVTSYSASVSHVSGSASQSLSVSGAITNPAPSLVLNPTNLTGFTTTTNAPSAAQTFTVAGSNLTTNVTVGAPTGYEVANDAATWGTNTALIQTGGNASGTISVRLAAADVYGPRSGNVTVASGGLTVRLAVSGEIPVPNVPGLVYWDFDSATPTSGTGGAYASWTFGALTRSNGGTSALFDTSSTSSGYTNPFNVLASGTTNAFAAARGGVLNTNTNGSAFFELQVVVPSNTTTSITNISFGSRSTPTGPAAYSIRSSTNEFAADVFTNALTTNSTWGMNVAPVAIALSNGTNTIRIYGYNGTATGSNTVNWRIDDLTLALSGGTGPTPPSGLSYTPSSVNGVVGTPITSMVPTVTGSVTNYSVNPALPGGLSLDASSGVISGTPTIPASPASYTVTASNDGGSTTANVTITVLSAYQAGYSAWASGFQLDPLVTTGPTAGAPSADPDSDGFNNASEYAFGTNPTVPNGALLTTTSSNSIFRSSWPGPASGVTYSVWSTTNLASTAFTNDPTAPILTNGGVLSFTNQATGSKFFRVRSTSN